MRLAVRIAAAALCVAALILLAVPLGRRSALPPPMVVHGRASLQVRSEAPVEVGAQKVPIEVPRGAPLGGYAGRRRAESEGRVYARALVLRSGEVRAVIVALDALLVSSDLEEEVLRRTQLPPRTCLLLAATHTHSGPGGTWDNALAELAGNGRFDRGMRDAVAQAVADAIRGALGYLRTGRFAIAQVEWGDGPAVVRSAGPVDPTLLALQARDEGGLVVATLVVYAMHPTVLPSSSHVPSGDWPGAAARALEQDTQAPALVLQGAGGNATWSREGLPADGAGAAQANGQESKTGQVSAADSATEQTPVNGNAPVTISGGDVTSGPSSANQNASAKSHAGSWNSAPTSQSSSQEQSVGGTDACKGGCGGAGGAQLNAQHSETAQASAAKSATKQTPVNGNAPVTISAGGVTSGPSSANQNAAAHSHAGSSNSAPTNQWGTQSQSAG